MKAAGGFVGGIVAEGEARVVEGAGGVAEGVVDEGEVVVGGGGIGAVLEGEGEVGQGLVVVPLVEMEDATVEG